MCSSPSAPCSATAPTRAARESLGRALSIFQAIARGPWEAKTRDELRESAVADLRPESSPKASVALPCSPRRGSQNKEIAAALFIAVSTVEAHLSRVYRKLGVRSRTELAGPLHTR